MTEVSAFMPKTTQEVVGLFSILFFLFLILGSLRSWARRVPNATTRLPAGVDGLLFPDFFMFWAEFSRRTPVLQGIRLMKDLSIFVGRKARQG